MSAVNPSPYETVRGGEQLLFTLNNLQDSLDDTAINALTGWQNFYDSLIALARTKDNDRYEQIKRHAINILKSVRPAAIGITGVAQVETATVVATVTTAGNVTVIVTAAGMTGSPKTYSVAVALNDTAALVAGKIRAALAADLALSVLFQVGGTGALVTLTGLTPAANDSTLNINIADGTSVGVTTAASSANTTAGVAQGSAAADAVVVAWTGRADAIAFAVALMAASPVPAGFSASAFTQ